MKKFSKAASLLAAGALLFGGLFLSCDDGDDDDDPKLTSVVAVTTGAKTSYTADDTFSADNIKVYAFYDNATDTGSDPSTNGKDVTSSATFKAKDGTTLVSGTTKMTTAMSGDVTISYNNVAASEKLTITVAAKDGDDTALTEVAAGWTGSIEKGTWWTKFAGKDVQVKSGYKVTAKLTITDVGTANYHTPIVILRDSTAYTLDNAAATAADNGSKEYALLRTDNYGWGDNYASAILDSDWEWGTDGADFRAYVKGSTMTLTVKNYGTGKADVLMDFDKDGTAHHQYYTGIDVTADNLYVNMTFEECAVTFTESSSGSDDSGNGGSETTEKITGTATFLKDVKGGSSTEAATDGFFAAAKDGDLTDYTISDIELQLWNGTAWTAIDPSKSSTKNAGQNGIVPTCVEGQLTTKNDAVARESTDVFGENGKEMGRAKITVKAGAKALTVKTLSAYFASGKTFELGYVKVDGNDYINTNGEKVGKGIHIDGVSVGQTIAANTEKDVYILLGKASTSVSAGVVIDAAEIVLTFEADK